MLCEAGNGNQTIGDPRLSGIILGSSISAGRSDQNPCPDLPICSPPCFNHMSTDHCKIFEPAPAKTDDANSSWTRPRRASCEMQATYR